MYEENEIDDYQNDPNPLDVPGKHLSKEAKSEENHGYNPDPPDTSEQQDYPPEKDSQEQNTGHNRPVRRNDDYQGRCDHQYTENTDWPRDE